MRVIDACGQIWTEQLICLLQSYTWACDYTHTATMANTSFRRPSYCLQDEFPGDSDPLLKCVGYTLAIYFEGTSLFCWRISINGLP
jgi:hypothetical protein